MRFFSPKNENEVKTLAKPVNRLFEDSSEKKKTFQVTKCTKICSNHFDYGRPEEAAPNPTLFLKSYDDDAKLGAKRKAPTSRKEPRARKKIGTSIRDQNITTRGEVAARNTIRFRLSPTFSIFMEQKGKTNLFNVC